ncbi:hypothetical protein ACFLZF_00010 [Nanoarchaeota archaeon]
MKKKAISGVVTAVLMIALVMAMGSVVWVIVNNIVQEKLDEAGSCIDIFEKIKINNEYTCFNASSKELQFSIGIKDIQADGALISVLGSGESKSFRLTTKGISEEFLKKYPDGNYGETIFLPGKNSGKTYVMNTELAQISSPNSIKIAPIINNNQCEVSDSFSPIDDCRKLAN